MEKITLKVEGMSCAHCEKAVTNALTDLGAAAVTASAANNQVEIEYDPNRVSLAVMEQEIAECGYEIKR